MFLFTSGNHHARQFSGGAEGISQPSTVSRPLTDLNSKALGPRQTNNYQANRQTDKQQRNTLAANTTQQNKTQQHSRHEYSLPKLTGQKSVNCLFTTNMVFPKSLKSINSGSDNDPIAQLQLSCIIAVPARSNSNRRNLPQAQQTGLALRDPLTLSPPPPRKLLVHGVLFRFPLTLSSVRNPFTCGSTKMVVKVYAGPTMSPIKPGTSTAC